MSILKEGDTNTWSNTWAISQSSQSAAPATTETKKNKEDSGFRGVLLKHYEFTLKLFFGLVASTYAFILALQKIESGIFFQVVGVVVILIGGSVVAKAVIDKVLDRMPLPESNDTKTNV